MSISHIMWKKNRGFTLQAFFVTRISSHFLCSLHRLLNQIALGMRYLEILGTCSFREYFLYEMDRYIMYIYNLLLLDNFVIQIAFN